MTFYCVKDSQQLLAVYTAYIIMCVAMCRFGTSSRYRSHRGHDVWQHNTYGYTVGQKVNNLTIL